MEVCKVCGEKAAKYRCPACAERTCSVGCVKEHKERSKCTGKRCKTGFVSLSEFNDTQLFSDYYFLEDVGRHGDSTRRDRIHRERDEGENRSQRQRFHWLKCRAAERGVALLLQPPGMSLHKRNTSRTVGGKQRGGWSIEWKMDLLFPSSGVDYHEKHIPESMLISQLLHKYLHPTDSDPIARHRLRRYVDEGGVDGATVLMEAANTPGHKPSYHILEKHKSVCDNLRNKTVIEYPTLTVVLTSQLTHYSLLDEASHAITASTSDSDKTESGRKEEELAVSMETADERPPMIERRNSSDWSEDEQHEDCNSLQLIARMYSSIDND